MSSPSWWRAHFVIAATTRSRRTAAAPASASPARGGRRAAGAHHGRERHGQGSRGPDVPCCIGAPERALRRGQLLGGGGGAVRERVLRTRARRVHGRDRLAARVRGGGGRRDALSRRNRRDPAHMSAEALAVSRGPELLSGGWTPQGRRRR